MLGKTGTKKIFFAENLKWGLYKKAPLTQHVRRGWHQKAQFKKNARQDWYRKVFLTQHVWQGSREKPLFIENSRRGWYKKTLYLNMLCGVGMKNLFSLKMLG